MSSKVKNIKVLVTGAAGFIGFHLCKELLKLDYEVVGLDNLNDYYSPTLKYDRLKQFGISKNDAETDNEICHSTTIDNFLFIRMDISDRENLPKLFESQKFDVVCNLAAQAGVRYSIKNPEIYIDSNVVGFLNILEACRQYNVPRLIYASSSSVYGNASKVPFSTDDNVDHPISLYAATKKSNELMAYTYSHLYGLKTTGIRFFTVYGPWGRPDMAMFLFTDAIIKGKPIKVFNYGDLERDFTYIDDITDGVIKILDDTSKKDLYSLYNIGNSKPVKLLEFINEIEKQLGVKAKKDMLPMQPGDVNKTWADVDNLIKDFNYKPETSITVGVEKFIKWYKSYY